MNNPLISILIPCYNAEKVIDQCLTSATSQTYKNIEILIMNDGSTDNSLVYLYRWTKKDERIKVFTQTNAGVSQTRNELLKLCSGEYFSWLDIDDTLLEESIEILYNKSFEGKADIVVGRTNGVYNNVLNNQIKVPYFPVWRRRKKMTNLQYVKSNICTPWASIIRKNFFDKLDVEFLPGRVFEDIGLMPFIYLKAKIFVAISETIYNYHKYHIKSNNISNFKKNAFSKRNDLLAITNFLFQKFKLEGWDRQRDYRIAINGIFFAILILNNILISNFTNDLKIIKLLKYNYYKLFESFGWKIKFSKTPWKLLGYIYLKISYINFFKNGSFFLKTSKINFINSESKDFYSEKNSNKLKVYKFDEEWIERKYEGNKNIIIEVDEVDYLKNYEWINLMKNKYILVCVKDANFNKFSNYLNNQNVNGITIDSTLFESKHFRDNENFLIVNIKYNHIDEFSFKKLLHQLKELNFMIRRPLIFLKCKKNKKIIKSTKKLIDRFIFIEDKKINENNDLKEKLSNAK